jgi:hypothetical protein
MTATHERQQIREAIAAALVGKTAAGARVFETRILPLRMPELPAVAVYSLSESSDDQQTAPRELKRRIDFAVEAAVKQGTNIDDALDAIALQVETAMDADPTFGGLASDSMLVGTQLDVVEEGDRMMGVAVLRYAVTYYTPERSATSAVLDDFETVDVRTSLGGEQAAADQAHDTIDGLET